jgi:S-adenosylmethionine:tRNA ribosyltransferase-isomerase
LLVSEFDFDLPEELVAQTAAPRGESRLLVLSRENGAPQHARISDLPRFLQSGDLLVVNDTKVFAARLLGTRVPSSGEVECLLLSPTGEPGVWDALVHPGHKLREGSLVRFEGAAGAMTGEVLARRFFGRRLIRLRSDSGASLDGLIDALGHVPLPPYIKRPDVDTDRERYQTVYAAVRGSVAAPTAGLHFTQALLDTLAACGVEQVAITLHVGYGTFKPVRTHVVEEHHVDPEQYEISEAAAEALRRARRDRRRIIAVGTTTTRALEDAAASGGGEIRPTKRAATTFIYPGFQFQAVNGLLTNFHLPRSSLLMLVCALAGRERILDAYREAIAARYRFYSYGDAMLIV